MTTQPTCEPWCDDHSEDEGECITLRCLYSHNTEPAAPSGDTAVAALAFKFKGIGPDQVDTVMLSVQFIPEEEEKPQIVLKFWDSSTDEDSATLSTTVDGLKDLYLNLGKAIQDLEQG